ncbi:MAG: FHA domain-containing protein [Deltaproteobacteria bacterium]|nr:FHA domain-containing protein [Deltaproteobacteria bacterium]
MATVEELENLLDDLDIDRDLAKAELETAQGKIEKAEARKDKVKPEIYQKVVGEYVAARDAAQAKLDEIEANIAATHAEIESTKAAAEEDARRAEEEARRAEEEAARRAEEERIAREEEERRAREEAERMAREEAERAAREAEERLRAEEEARSREEAERAAREDEARNAEANRRREEDRQAAREMIASLVSDRDAVMAEMAGPQNEMEEIEFRKEMGEFESDDEYDAAAASVREKLAGLNDRIAGIDVQIRELASAHGVESPVGPAPGEIESPAAAAELAPAETDAAIETLLESAPVAEAAVEEVEESAEAEDLHEEVVETLEGDWSDVERRFFESSADHRFFVNPCLIMHDANGRERVFEMAHEITTLGSAGMGEVDVMIEHASVDKKHARIKLEHGRYIIKDLGSRKGTYVNGKRIKKERLNHLDKVKIGDVFLQVRLM